MNLRFDPVLESAIETVFSKKNAIQQHEWELRTLLRYVLDYLEPIRTVELGSWKGYAGAILSLVTSIKTVSIDNAEYGRYEDEALKLGRNIEFILDDCRSAQAVNRTMNLLQGPIDLLLLDDGHSYEDLTKEMGLWKPLVRPGGWIVIHDINPLANIEPNGQHPQCCQAHRYWADLKGDKTDIIALPIHNQWRGVIPHGGIGILKV